MRQPLRTKGQGGSTTSTVKSYPAPIGGLNARDALADMSPTDATDMDNFFPKTSYIEIRGGYATWATGTTGNIKTLAVYNSLTGTNAMFGLTNAGTYNITSSGAVGASVAARTNGKHYGTMFGDGTSNWLILPNGVDKPLYYDGTTWTAVDGGTVPALTGITTTSLIYAFVFKYRLMFIANNSMGFWYLAAGAAGGALTYFDLSGVAKKGGYLMAAGTWTVDTGFGPDDRCVFVSSEGEVIIYQGTNPSVAANWALIGVYALSKPLGRRCLLRYGSDLIVLTQNGEFPLSSIIMVEDVDYKLALSYKIEKAFTDAARTYGSIFGWEAKIYPAQSALVVNVPQAEDGTHVQYVMNTTTKSWCRFLQWNAETFEVFNGELYFASGTGTVKAWTGTIDGVNNIDAYAKCAFSKFGDERLKHFKLFQPILAVNGPLSYLTDIDIDYNDTPISGSASYSVVSGAQWDVSNWDVGMWAAGLEVVKQWTSPAEWDGYAASGKVKISTNSLTVQWAASTYVYETGGIYS